MTCLVLGNGITQNCRQSMGGVRRFLIAELSSIETVTHADGLVSAIGMKADTFFYEFITTRKSGAAAAPIEQSVENGQVSFNHTVTMVFAKREAAKRNALMVLAQKPLVVIEEDRNGKFNLFGWDYGLDFTEGGSESGTAASDLNGYNVTLSGEQKELEYEVASGIIAGLLPEA